MDTSVYTVLGYVFLLEDVDDQPAINDEQMEHLNGFLKDVDATLDILSGKQMEEEGGIHYYIGFSTFITSDEVEIVETCKLPNNFEQFHQAVSNCLLQTEQLTEEMIGEFGLHVIMYTDD